MSLLGDALRAVRTENVFGVDAKTGQLAAKPTEIPVRELARRSGVSHTQISRIESGAISKPAVDQLVSLGKALHRQPAPLLILAGHLTGEDARVELATLFYDAAELRDVWGDWMHLSWEEASRLVRDPEVSEEQLQLVAYDVFSAGETAQTLWDGQELLLGPGQSDLRQVLGTWYFLHGARQQQLLEYCRALRRVQELEELADAETWRLDATQLPATSDTVSAFSELALVELGFEGFARLLELPSTAPGVPAAPGVYVVIRRSGDAPTFLESSVGGHFKGEDPTVSIDRLRDEWVEGAATVYVGRASNLRNRINLLARYGRGEPVAHRGGRLLWQLGDHHDLLVAWLETPDQVSREAELVASFEDAYGRLPFANLNRPGGAS